AAPAADALIPLLQDRDPHLRVEVTITLAKIGKAAVPALIKAVGNDEKMIEMGACLTLGHMGATAKEAVPALKKLMGKSILPEVRCHAAQALWRIDPAQKDSVLPVLTEALATGDRNVRLCALTTISQMGGSASVVPAIERLLKDNDAQLRLAAATTLVNIDPKNTNILPTFV